MTPHQLSLPFPRPVHFSKTREQRAEYARRYTTHYKLRAQGMLSKRALTAPIERPPAVSNCGREVFGLENPLHLERAQQEALDLVLRELDDSDYGLFYLG